jgi:hypothetical protein
MHMSADTDDARWAPVRDWHAAVSARDLMAAKAVAAPDIRVGGPRGSAQGVDAFLDWVRDSGIRIEPVGWHTVDEHRVVVEQDAAWPGRADSGPDAAPVRIATLFEVRHGLITAALRYDEGVEAALDAARRTS